MVVINKTEKESDMYLGIAIKKAIEAGGGDVKDSKGRTWCIEPDGDISRKNPVVMKNSIENWWRGEDWDVVEEEKQPATQPELMNFVTACAHAAKIGGGKVTCGEGVEIIVNAGGAIKEPVRYGINYLHNIWEVCPLPLTAAT